VNEFQKALSIEMEQVYKDKLADQIRGGEIMEALNKIYQEKWNALPWYTKKWKRLQGWVYWTRRSVGEWVAGEKFNNV
jgi:hypothetical protein